MVQASAEKLEHTGLAEKERVASVPQSEQLAKKPEPPLPKGKGTEPSVQITRSCGERVKVNKSRILAREKKIRAGSWRGKDELYVKEGRFQQGEGGQATRASLEEVEGSMSG